MHRSRTGHSRRRSRIGKRRRYGRGSQRRRSRRRRCPGIPHSRKCWCMGCHSSPRTSSWGWWRSRWIGPIQWRIRIDAFSGGHRRISGKCRRRTAVGHHSQATYCADAGSPDPDADPGRCRYPALPERHAFNHGPTPRASIHHPIQPDRYPGELTWPPRHP